MPLVGITDDITGEHFTFAEAIERARWGQGGHEPLPLLVAIMRNAEERADAGISATMLLSCPRETVLKQLVDYYERPSDYWARFRGTMGHYMMEVYGADLDRVMQEVRFRKSIMVDGVPTEVTGKPDWVDLDRKLIIDFKTVKSINTRPINLNQPKPGHTEQVNVYRWLLWGGVAMKASPYATVGETVHFEIERGGIQYFDMKGYQKIGVEVWPLAATSDFVVQKLRPLVAYQQTGQLPHCLKETGNFSFCKCDELFTLYGD